MSLLIVGGIFVGLYFASFVGPYREFKWGAFIAYTFLLVVVGTLGIYFYWSFKRKRERRSPRKIRTVQALRQHDLISAEEHLIEDKIKPIINKLGVISFRETDESIPRLLFEFHKDHKYNFLYNISIKVVSPTDIRLDAILRTDYPISLSIKKKTKKEEITSGIVEIISSKFFSFHSSHHVAFEEIFTKEKFNELQLEMKEGLINLSLNGKFVSATFSNYSILVPLFQQISFIHDELMLKDFSSTEIEQITCYECGDVFDADEETCTNCGATRPRCKVCLLDMKPSEKSKVIQTPCCEVYAHREHIIGWLETNPTCPNCKKDLFLLLRSLKKNNSS